MNIPMDWMPVTLDGVVIVTASSIRPIAIDPSPKPFAAVPFPAVTLFPSAMLAIPEALVVGPNARLFAPDAVATVPIAREACPLAVENAPPETL